MVIVTLSSLDRTQRAETNVAECSYVFPDELRVSSFSSVIGSHTMPAQNSQPTPTSLGHGCMRVWVQPATYTSDRMTGVFYVPLR